MNANVRSYLYDSFLTCLKAKPSQIIILLYLNGDLKSFFLKKDILIILSKDKHVFFFLFNIL